MFKNNLNDINYDHKIQQNFLFSWIFKPDILKLVFVCLFACFWINANSSFILCLSILPTCMSIKHLCALWWQRPESCKLFSKSYRHVPSQPAALKTHTSYSTSYRFTFFIYMLLFKIVQLLVHRLLLTLKSKV